MNILSTIVYFPDGSKLEFKVGSRQDVVMEKKGKNKDRVKEISVTPFNGALNIVIECEEGGSVEYYTTTARVVRQ